MTVPPPAAGLADFLVLTSRYKTRPASGKCAVTRAMMAAACRFAARSSTRRERSYGGLEQASVRPSPDDLWLLRVQWDDQAAREQQVGSANGEVYEGEPISPWKSRCTASHPLRSLDCPNALHSRSYRTLTRFRAPRLWAC